MLTSLPWLGLLILAWSPAVFAFIFYPIAWIVAFSFRLVGASEKADFDLPSSAISFPARALRGRGAIT